MTNPFVAKQSKMQSGTQAPLLDGILANAGKPASPDHMPIGRPPWPLAPRRALKTRGNRDRDDT